MAISYRRLWSIRYGASSHKQCDRMLSGLNLGALDQGNTFTDLELKVITSVSIHDMTPSGYGHDHRLISYHES